MRLTSAQRRDVFEILDRIDEGLATPEIPGEVGRFLRQYGRGRAELQRVLSMRRLGYREDGALSGRSLGAVTAFPMREPKIQFRGRQLGEVADATVICEELGCVAHLVMWLKSTTASTALDTLRQHAALRLEGDYRWTPPSRITTGEASVRMAPEEASWQRARILKAVSDDLERPPHALEYVRDHHFGDSSLKFFRCVCARRDGDGWQVLPGLGRSKALRVASAYPSARSTGEPDCLVLLLIYREPWSDVWTIVEEAETSPSAAFSHAIAWTDMQLELRGLPLDTDTLAGIRDALRLAGVRVGDLGEPSMTRKLLPAARDIVCHLRGIRAASP